MRSGIRETLHDLKERVIHPFGHRSRQEEEPARAGKDAGEREREEQKVDKTAGSEFLGD
jgi:hypothetical protein